MFSPPVAPPRSARNSTPNHPPTCPPAHPPARPPTQSLAATVSQHNIAAVPTFVGMQGGRAVTAFSGADRAQLLRTVKELSGTLAP